MKYNQLTTAKRKTAQRVGRGIAAGQGKTAGRGTKGQLARTGARKRPGFEGGQNPLMQRLPKLPGFTSHRPRAEVVYTGQLDAFAGKVADAEAFSKAGLVSNPYVRVKVIAKGEVTKKVTVKAQAISRGALDAVQSAGGSFEKVPVAPRPASRTADKKPPKQS